MKTATRKAPAKKAAVKRAPAKKAASGRPQVKGDTSRMTRSLYPMPAQVRKALLDQGLMQAYQQRPAYQQNDYVGWISRAKLEATQQKRLAQMLKELKEGTHYMNMAWRPS